jgi:hypothetical protein
MQNSKGGSRKMDGPEKDEPNELPMDSAEELSDGTPSTECEEPN